MTKLSNKQRRALDYMISNGSISSKEAIEKLGDSRLAVTIKALRDKGYNIRTVRVNIENRYNEPSWYGRHFLDD